MRKPANHFLFPKFRGEFDAVMCEDEGTIYVKETATNEIWEVEEGKIQDFFTEMPQGWTVGIVMPDGSVAKITPNH